MNNLIRVFKFLDRIIDRVCSSGALLSGVLIIIMGFATTYGAATRYLFNHPDKFAYELACIFLVFASFLSIAYVTWNNSNFRADFVTNFLPKKIQVVLINVLAPILGLVFCGVLTWASWKSANYALEIGETSTSTWRVPLFPVKIIIPIGAALVCIVLVSQLCHGISSLKGMFTKTQK